MIGKLMALDWTAIVTALLAILGGASVIAKMTPTTWDDKIIGKLINLIGLAKKVTK